MTKNRVRSARLFARIFTLRDFASRTGLSISRLSRIERGEADPRLSEILRIAAALPGEDITNLWSFAADGRKGK